MAKKTVDQQRRAAMDSFIRQLDAAEYAAQQVTRNRDQIGVLRSWAEKGFGKSATFDDLKPSAISRLLAASLEASGVIGAEVVRLDHLMSDVLAESGKP